MKKVVLCFALGCLSWLPIRAQSDVQLDTIYYDKEWKGVGSKVFATYYRVVIENDSSARKMHKDYFITGELQSEGTYTSIDREDDAKSVFEGPFVTYYKSGAVEKRGTHVNGKLEGEWTWYYENGLIHQHAFLKGGEMDGIFTEFREDGLCVQVEYAMGKPKYDYYTVSTQDGFAAKYRMKDDSPVLEQPTLAEMEVEYTDGMPIKGYAKNGIIVATGVASVQEYGKYYKVAVMIGNYTIAPIEIDPSLIRSKLVTKKGKEMALTVLSSEEYMKKVNRRQYLTLALMSMAQGAAAQNAGKSSSTTTTTTSTSGTVTASGTAKTRGGAVAVGSDGWAAAGYGSTTNYRGSANYSGTSTTTSHTEAYDGAAAYQAQVLANNQIAAYDMALAKDQQAREEGYLKRTTIYPGELIAGYVCVEREKGVDLEVTIVINGIEYVFPWKVQ